ncbi:amidase [Tomitella cavernea]|uniref:amidase n=1 Tax=Tomitella cavernea TaxID=1387982 RepID=A0ABP9D2A2_9ACTN|nr:amidase [Tomitella cavernea]
MDPNSPGARPADLADWTAAELVGAFRCRDVSPVDAIRAVLRRIADKDEALNAYCLIDEEHALAAAADSERRWMSGRPLSGIDGVPTSIKDIFLTDGWPTLRGSRTIDPAGPWTEDAPAVARLRAAGAVCPGKTTTPELAWKGVTDSPLHGATRTPWDTSRTSGGSSGGAAAAVSAGMGPLAIGTDGGGSVRIPGSFCGVVGFKPTYGTVPMYPPSPFGTLAHVGPITRTVEDAALLMDVITGFDSRDWSALATPTRPYSHDQQETATGLRALDGLRVAFSRTLGFAPLDDEVGSVVDKAVDVLESLGARVERTDPGFEDPLRHFECLWYSGAAKATAHLTDRQRDLMEPALRKVCEQGLDYSAQNYLDAMEVRMNMGVRMGAFHETYDLLITPSMPIPPFEAGLEVPPGWQGEHWPTWCQYSYPFNMTQQPAASVPCGFTADRLPVGMQIVGPRHGDRLVLTAARAYQDATQWWRARP